MGRIKQHKKKTKKDRPNGKNVYTPAQKESIDAAKLFTSDLSPEHPLERCVINQNWQESHLASIMIVRRVGSGLTVAGFLVDLWGVGLKDGFSHTGVSPRSLDRMLARLAGNETWVDCPLSLAQELVYGSLAWAHKHGFYTPPDARRCVEIIPAPPGEPDLSRFGYKDGRPMIIGDLEEMGKFLPRG